MEIEGLKIIYAMNYDKEFEAFELSYLSDVKGLQERFDEMVEKHPHCVVKQAVVINEYSPNNT